MMIEYVMCSPLPGCHRCLVVCGAIFQSSLDGERDGSTDKLAWTRATFYRIFAKLLDFDWEFLFEGLSTDEYYELFLEIFGEYSSKYVPHRNSKIRGK